MINAFSLSVLVIMQAKESERELKNIKRSVSHFLISGQTIVNRTLTQLPRCL